VTGSAIARIALFALRRDRFLLPWWIVGGVLLYWSQAVSVESLYPTQAEFDAAAEAMANNAAFIAMAGPARALNTVGGQVTWQASAFGAVVAGLMSMIIVGRHTRAEEESGRDELVRAGAVGRLDPLVAVSLVVLLANAVLGGLISASLIAYGLAVAGSISLGLAAALAGLVFGAAALVAAQLTQATRTLYGLAGMVIAASYVLRAVGDVGNHALSWLSPIGWGQAMHAFSGERWWPALISAVAALALGAVAVRLFNRRDIGSGVWSARPGPATAGPRLRSPFGLAWRLQRGALAAWTVGMLLTGLAYGATGDQVGDIVGDSEFSRTVFRLSGASLVDSFYGVAALMLALISAGFAISSSLRPRGEELDGRLEPLLATGVSRWRWAASHLAISFGGTTVVVAAGGLGLGLGYALVTDDAGALPRLFGATIPYVAPILVLVAVTWLMYGLRPRWAGVGWVALTFCVVVMVFGELLRFPQWVIELSPFSHLALTPAQPFTVDPVLWLLLLSGAVTGTGLVAFRHRDTG
jgi:ABC-2 type transport system permease protein